MREENAGDKRRTRRHIIQAGVASAAGAVIAAPYIRNAEAATTTTWKVQTSWPAGVGLKTFKTGARTIKEKTGGELEFKPFAAKEVVGDFELLDGVKNGVLEAMNSFSRLLGRQNPGDRLPLVLPDGPALSARVGHLLLRQGRRADGPRDLRQAGSVLCRPHPSRPEYHPLEEADPLDRGLQGPEAARAWRHDRRGLCGCRRPHDAASGRRGVLRARKGHDRRSRLHRTGGELGPRLPASHQVHLDGPAGTGVDLPAGRPDGLRREHGCLEQAVAAR